MDEFVNGICLRVLDGSRNQQLDAVVYFDGGREIVPQEFSALVTMQRIGTRVSEELIISSCGRRVGPSCSRGVRSQQDSHLQQGLLRLPQELPSSLTLSLSLSLEADLLVELVTSFSVPVSLHLTIAML
jgi:hypothetical protein